MGFLDRFKRVIKAKLNRGLDRLEDPAEQLDYAYEELKGEQQKIDKAIRDVTADKKLIEENLEEHREAKEEAHRKAKRYRRNALSLEEKLESVPDPDRREKLRSEMEKYNEGARKALKKKGEHEEKIESLEKKLEKTRRWVESIKEKRLNVKAKLERVQMEKESLKSEWRMAQAESRIESALSGLGDEVGDVDLTISRAKDKIKRKRALASASREVAEEDLVEGSSEESIPELEESTVLLEEEELAQLDREIKERKEGGPFLLVSVSGGGTWALSDERGTDFRRKVDDVDEEISDLYERGELDEDKFDRLYGEIFDTLREEGLLVGEDIGMEEVTEGEELLPEPEVELPPRDLEFEEARKILQGQDLIGHWEADVESKSGSEA